MQALSSACIFAILACSTAQEYFGVPPFHYHHGNGFFQQPPTFQPNFPPHFRPLGYHHQEYQSPFKHFPSFPHNEQPFSNDLNVRSHLPNPYLPDYSDFYNPYPNQFDDAYPDIHEYNKIPHLRDPVQILPSRFPPRVEGFVESLQNRFSIYNSGPTVLPNGATVIFLPANATAPEGVEPSTSAPVSNTPTESTTESATESSVEPTEASTEVSEEKDVESITVPSENPDDVNTTEASDPETSTESAAS